MGKVDRKAMVVQYLVHTRLALPTAVLYRNLRLRQNATFSESTLKNYLSELEEELEGTTVRRERVERKLEGDLEDEDVDRESLEEERQRLEERTQQLEDDIAAAKDEELRISGQLPGSKVIRRSKEQIPNEASPALAAKEFQENLLRNAVDTLGGEEVSYRELRGTKLDEWFSPKEQHLLITVLSDELTADDESEDFLTSVEMG